MSTFYRSSALHGAHSSIPYQSAGSSSRKQDDENHPFTRDRSHSLHARYLVSVEYGNDLQLVTVGEPEESRGSVLTVLQPTLQLQLVHLLPQLKLPSPLGLTLHLHLPSLAQTPRIDEGVWYHLFDPFFTRKSASHSEHYAGAPIAAHLVLRVDHSRAKWWTAWKSDPLRGRWQKWATTTTEPDDKAGDPNHATNPEVIGALLAIEPVERSSQTIGFNRIAASPSKNFFAPPSQRSCETSSLLHLTTSANSSEMADVTQPEGTEHLEHHEPVRSPAPRRLSHRNLTVNTPSTRSIAIGYEGATGACANAFISPSPPRTLHFPSTTPSLPHESKAHRTVLKIIVPVNTSPSSSVATSWGPPSGTSPDVSPFNLELEEVQRTPDIASRAFGSMLSSPLNSQPSTRSALQRNYAIPQVLSDEVGSKPKVSYLFQSDDSEGSPPKRTLLPVGNLSIRIGGNDSVNGSASVPRSSGLYTPLDSPPFDLPHTSLPFSAVPTVTLGSPTTLHSMDEPRASATVCPDLLVPADRFRPLSGIPISPFVLDTSLEPSSVELTAVHPVSVESQLSTAPSSGVHPSSQLPISASDYHPKRPLVNIGVQVIYLDFNLYPSKQHQPRPIQITVHCCDYPHIVVYRPSISPEAELSITPTPIPILLAPSTYPILSIYPTARPTPVDVNLTTFEYPAVRIYPATRLTARPPPINTLLTASEYPTMRIYPTTHRCSIVQPPAVAILITPTEYPSMRIYPAAIGPQRHGLPEVSTLEAEDNSMEPGSAEAHLPKKLDRSNPFTNDRAASSIKAPPVIRVFPVSPIS